MNRLIREGDIEPRGARANPEGPRNPKGPGEEPAKEPAEESAKDPAKQCSKEIHHFAWSYTKKKTVVPVCNFQDLSVQTHK